MCPESRSSLIPDICENVATGLVVLDENFTVLEVNREVERKGKVRSEELVGRCVLEFINDEDRDMVRERLERARNGSVERVMARLKTPVSDKYWVYLRFERYENLILMSMIDINKMVEHENRLRSRNAELETIHNFVNAISGVLEPEELYEVTYRELDKILGGVDAFTVGIIDEAAGVIDIEFVVGDGHRYAPHTIPLNDKDTLTGWVALHGESLHIHDIDSEETPSHPRLVGVPMRTWLGVPLRYQGKVVGVVTVQSKKPHAFSEEDVRLLNLISVYLSSVIYSSNLYSRLKASEERYRGIVSMSMVGFIFTDRENRITFVNDAMADMLGYEKEEMIGRTPLDFVDEGSVDRIKEGIERRRRGLTDTYEATLKRKDGSKVPVIIYATPLRDDRGNFTETMAAVADISVVKALEQKLRESKQFMELLLHVLSHDLKTPLGIIMGYGELLKESYDEEFVDEIMKAVESILTMLSKIRLLSKLDMHRIDEAREEFSVVEVLGETVELVSKKYQHGKIEIEDDDAIILGYRALFEEMMMNLLTNAFKHGAKSVVVSVRKDCNSIVIRVADDGPGISEDRKEKIFEPFSRESRGGAGLGLSIVKRIVDIHGGKIRVEDNEPHGAVFVVELPINAK